MRKKLIYFIGLILCVLLGALGVCFLVYKYPVETIKTITEKNVSITDTGIAESVEKIENAVVVVEIYSKGALAGTGTGFVYDTDKDNAYILTNHHVIESSETIKITYADESETEATIVGSDEYADIAVLKVDKNTILGKAEIGTSANMKKGDTVFTIGSPMGIDYAGTVTKGILSGKDRLVGVSISGNEYDWIMNVMQTDAAINPGNSGGPLCNINGEVIGINSMKIVESTIEGIGFAIPIEDAINYAKSLRENGSINRPYIGVSMINATSTYQLAYQGIRLDKDITEGVVIAEVVKDSPAEKAGIKAGDVVIKVENNKVSDIAQFRYRLYSYKIDETIKIEVIRDGKTKELKIKLGSN